MSELFAFSDEDGLGGSTMPLGDVVDTDVSSDSGEEGEEVHPSKKARGKMKGDGGMNHDATSDAIEKEMLMRELRRQREQLKTLKESIGASSAGRNSDSSASSSSVQFLRALREARRASSSRESEGDAEDPASRLTGDYKRIYLGLKNQDESIQMLSLDDICCTLATANEYSLAGFSPRIFVPLLLEFVEKKKHNGNMMLTAVRALTHLIDMVPAISVIAVANNAVDILCATLNNIQYVDVAEQSMKCLRLLAEDHPSAILKGDGVASVLKYIDFFSKNTQHQAVATAAMACRKLQAHRRHFDTRIKGSLLTLTNLLQYSDPKIVEGAATCFVRIVNAYKDKESVSKEIVKHGLLPQLISIISNINDDKLSVHKNGKSVANRDRYSPSTQNLAIKILSMLSKTSPDLGLKLIDLDLPDVLSRALTSQSSEKDPIRWSMSKVGSEAAENSASLKKAHSFHSTERSGSDKGPGGLPANDTETNLLFRAKSSPAMSPVHTTSSTQLYDLISLIDTLLPAVPGEGKLETSPRQRKKAKAARLKALKRKKSVSTAASQMDEDASGKQKKCKTDKDNHGKDPHESEDNSFHSATSQGQTKVHAVDGDAKPVSDKVLDITAPEKAHLLLKVAQTMLPSLLLVYTSVTSVSVCTLCLSVLNKILYWMRADDLKRLLEPTLQRSKLSEFLASLLSQSDLQIVLLSLKMCLHTLKKAHVFVRDRFLRDGIVTQIREYSKGFGRNGKHDAISGAKVAHKKQIMMSPSSRGMSPARAAAYAARYHRVTIEATAVAFLNLYCNSKTIIDSEVGDPKLHGNISSVMQRLIEIRKLLETVMSEMIPIGGNNKTLRNSNKDTYDHIIEKNRNNTILLESNSTSGGGMQRKSKRAKRTHATFSPGSESQVVSMESRYMDILRSLKDVLVCDASVSTHELLHSGIIDGLHMFLTELRSVETISASVSPANSTDSRTSFEYHPQSPTISLASKQNSLLSDTRSADFFRYKDRLCRIQSFLHMFFLPSSVDGPSTAAILPAHVLLERLQAAIASCERFPTYLKENLGSSSSKRNDQDGRYIDGFRRSNRSFSRGQTENKFDKGLALLTSPLRIRLMPVPSNSTADSKELANDESQHNNGNSKSTNAEVKIQRAKVSLPLENSEGITVLIEPMASSKSLFEFLVRKLNDEDVDSQNEYDSDSDEVSNSEDIAGSMKEESDTSEIPSSSSSQLKGKKKSVDGKAKLEEDKVTSNGATDEDKEVHIDARDTSSAKEASQTKTENTKIKLKLENIHLYINGYTIHPETTLIEAVSKSGGLGKGFLTEDAMLGAVRDKTCNGDLRKVKGCMPPNVAVWNSSHVIYYKIQAVKTIVDSRKAKASNRDVPVSPRRARPKRKERPSVTPDYASKFSETDTEDPLLNIHDSRLLGTRTTISQFESTLLETLHEEGAVSKILSNGEDNGLDSYTIHNDANTSSTGKEPLPMLMTLVKVIHVISSCIHDNGSECVSRAMEDVMESSNGMAHIAGHAGEYLAVEPANFLNNKLASKLLHQAQDSLAVCSRCLPTWCPALTQNYRFFFPFETRRQFFFSSAFCAQRSMLYMLNQAESRGQSMTKSQKDRLNRLERIKIKVDRNNVLDSAKGLFFKFDTKNVSFDIEFEGEVGTGEGPTMEFFTLVAKDFQSKSLELWIDTRKVSDESSYCFAPQGLFPRPFTNSIPDAEAARRRSMYELLGKFIGQALVDRKLLAFVFSPVLLKEIRKYQDGARGLYREKNKTIENVEAMLSDLSLIDFDLWKQMKKLYDLGQEYKKIVSDSSLTPQQKETMINSLGINGAKVEQLCLDFTLPGYDDIEILEGGSSVDVTVANLEKYVEGVCTKMIKETLGNVMPSIVKGLSMCLDVSYFSSFTIAELGLLIAGKKALFTKEELDNNLLYDHGYASNSKAVVLLREILVEFDQTQQEQFLVFVTGSPRLPCEGLAGLSPRLTVVRKIPAAADISSSVTADASLPSASTCTNYFKLPEYKTKEIMREKILKAISYGRNSFHLS